MGNSKDDESSPRVAGRKPELKDIDKDRSGRESQWIKKAIRYYEEEDFEKALKYFEKASERDVEDPHILFNIAVCMMRGGLYDRHKELIEAFDRVLSLDKSYKDVWTNKGSYLASCGNLIDALSCFNRSIELLLDPRVLENRGNVYLELANYRKALEDFEKSLELGGDKPELIYKKGVALMELRKFEEALGCFESAEEMGYDRSKEMELSKAEIYLGLGRVWDAIGCCDKVLEEEPANLRARGLKGVMYHYCGLDDYAKKELEKAKEIAEEKGLENSKILRLLEKTLERMDISDTKKGDPGK